MVELPTKKGLSGVCANYLSHAELGCEPTKYSEFQGLLVLAFQLTSR